jgi:metal-responsive CopG/Arc/MetJ family transcriptional regulator
MNGRRILSLSLPFDLLKEIQQVSKEEHVSKSELLRSAVTDFIGRWKWEKAKKAGKRAAREMKITQEDIEGILHGFRKS